MLKKLRAKPDHIKQTVSIVVAGVLTACILFVWWSSREARVHTTEEKAQALSPINGFMSVVQGLVTQMQESVSNVTPSNKDGLSFEDPAMKDEVNSPPVAATTTGQSGFDLSGIVVIDPSTSTTTQASSSAPARR